MDKNKKKSSLIFNLSFTTSKLLSYIVVITSSILGYILTSAEIVVIGLIVAAALSGVKNITESLVKLKYNKTNKDIDNDNDTQNKLDDSDLSEKEKEIL